MYILAAVTLINIVFRPQSVFMCFIYFQDKNPCSNGHYSLDLQRYHTYVCYV